MKKKTTLKAKQLKDIKHKKGMKILIKSLQKGADYSVIQCVNYLYVIRGCLTIALPVKVFHHILVPKT